MIAASLILTLHFTLPQDASLAPPQDASLAPPQDASLETLLDRARQQRQAELEEARPAFASSLQRLADGIREEREREVDVSLRSLRDMAGAAGVLLCDQLVPADAADTAAIELADTALIALRDIRPSTAEMRLLQIGERVDGDDCERVYRALAAVAAPLRAVEFLNRRFESGDGARRRAAVTALAEIGDDRATTTLGRAVESKDVALARHAILLAAKYRNTSFAPFAVELLNDPTRGPLHLFPLARYFRAVPDAFGEEHLRTTVGYLTGRGAPDPDDAARVLELLSDVPLDRKRAAEAVGRLTGRPDVLGEAAEVLLARLGDRTVAKRLDSRYSRQVESARDGESEPYMARAKIYLRMHRFSDSISDFKRALKEAERPTVFMQREVHLGMARAYAADGKFPRALDELEASEPSGRRLRELAQEPWFEEMVEHPRYGRIFRFAVE